MQNCTSQMSSIVFGGHSPIAIAITKELSALNTVHHITRNPDVELSKQLNNLDKIVLHQLPFDYDNRLDLSLTIKLVLDLNPKTIVFASRYRNQVFDVMDAFRFEIMLPIEILTQVSSNLSQSDLKSVVFLTSPAGSKVVRNQEIYYHTNKAALEQIVRYFSLHMGGVRVNGVSPGSFVMKPRSEEFYKSNPELMNKIKEFIPTSDFVHVHDISKLVKFLTSDESKQINGQIIGIDGGYRNWEESSYLLQ